MAKEDPFSRCRLPTPQSLISSWLLDMERESAPTCFALQETFKVKITMIDKSDFGRLYLYDAQCSVEPLNVVDSAFVTETIPEGLASVQVQVMNTELKPCALAYTWSLRMSNVRPPTGSQS
jgi:hypothetical protein